MTPENAANVTAQLSEIFIKAGASLFKATKYMYAMTHESSYQVDIQDFFKVILNNIFNADLLGAFDIAIDGEACAPLNTREYFSVYPLIIYSMAVRLPLLCADKVRAGTLNKRQIDAVYNAVMERGVTNTEGILSEGYEDIAKAVRKKKSVSPYSADWFKTYIYTSVPELAEISSRNLYFLGAADVLLPLYYMCFEKAFDAQLNSLLSGNKQ